MAPKQSISVAPEDDELAFANVIPLKAAKELIVPILSPFPVDTAKLMQSSTAAVASNGPLMSRAIQSETSASVRCLFPEPVPPRPQALSQDNEYGVNAAIDISRSEPICLTESTSHLLPPSEELWSRHKALLLQLYMVENHPLDIVKDSMQRNHGFRASERMYKSRFSRWGWRKNKSKQRDIKSSSFRGQAVRTRRAIAAAEPIHNLRSPTIYRDLESAIFETRRLLVAQIGKDGWTSGQFTLTPSVTLHDKLPDLYTPDICLLYAMHQMRQEQVVSAFTAISTIFSLMPTSIHTQHLKSVPGLWLLYRKVLDICLMIKDGDLQLLRMMMLFKAHYGAMPLQARFSAFGFFSKLLSSLAKMYRSEPQVLHEIFRQGYVAVARTLEEQLGSHHPTVLQTWGNLAWYWELSDTATKDIIARYELVFKRAETVYGSTHIIPTCMLCDFALLLFHSGHQRAHVRGVVEDLWTRIEIRMAEACPQPGSPFQRVAAMAAVLFGCVLTLDGPEHVDRAREICDAVLFWLQAGTADDARMLADMLEADRAVLLGTSSRAGTLQTHHRDLNFMRPRCFDMEREEM